MDKDRHTKKEWVGVMIRITDEVFTGLSYSVPGWECPDCGWRLGMIDYPNFFCPKCGFDSSNDSVKTEESDE